MTEIVILYDACLHKNYVISIMNFIFEVGVNATIATWSFVFMPESIFAWKIEIRVKAADADSFFKICQCCVWKECRS